MVNIRYNLLAQSPSQTVKLQVLIQLLLPLPGLLQAHLDPLLPLFCQSSCKRRWMNAKKQDVGDFQGCAGGISGSTHMRSSTCSWTSRVSNGSCEGWCFFAKPRVSLVGKIVGHSIVMDCQGFPFLSPAFYYYMVGHIHFCDKHGGRWWMCQTCHFESKGT